MKRITQPAFSHGPDRVHFGEDIGRLVIVVIVVVIIVVAGTEVEGLGGDCPTEGDAALFVGQQVVVALSILGFGVWGLGFGVLGLGIWGLGFRVQG